MGPAHSGALCSSAHGAGSEGTGAGMGTGTWVVPPSGLLPPLLGPRSRATEGPTGAGEATGRVSGSYGSQALGCGGRSGP